MGLGQQGGWTGGILQPQNRIQCFKGERSPLLCIICNPIPIVEQFKEVYLFGVLIERG